MVAIVVRLHYRSKFKLNNNMNIYKNKPTLGQQSTQPFISINGKSGAIRCNKLALEALGIADGELITFGYDEGKVYAFKTEEYGVKLTFRKDSLVGCSKSVTQALLKDLKLATDGIAKFKVTDEPGVGEGLLGYKLDKI